LNAGPFSIDVVIPTFNRAAMLEALVGSLAAQRYPPEKYQVILVDDGSLDDTWPLLQELAGRHKIVRAIRIEHGGPAVARNEGWKAGSGAIVAFTDDDCVADPDWLAAIADKFARRPEALGVQGKTVTIPRLTTPLTHQIVVLRANARFEACNVAYRRTALSAVGGFDEEAFHVADSELGAAVSALGPILFCPEMVIVHPPRPRAFRNREDWRRHLKGMLRMYCRYPDFYRRTRASHFLIDVVRRWVLGSTVKNVVLELPWLVRGPRIYLRFLAQLIRERAILLAMLPGFWREHREWSRRLRKVEPSKPSSEDPLAT
jgi:glycosyltransferase involved in cell wall biosynthesis